MSQYIVWIHAAIAAAGTIFFLLSYLKHKQIYQLLFVIWFPITLLNYVSSNKVYVYILGAVQFLLFLAVLFFLFRRQGGSMKNTLEQLDAIGKESPEVEIEEESEVEVVENPFEDSVESEDSEAGASAEAEAEKTVGDE